MAFAVILSAQVFAEKPLFPQRSKSSTLEHAALEYFADAAVSLGSADPIDEERRRSAIRALRNAFLVFVSRDGLADAAKNRPDASMLTYIHRLASRASDEVVKEDVGKWFLNPDLKVPVDGEVVSKEVLNDFYLRFLKMRSMTEEEVRNVRKFAIALDEADKKQKKKIEQAAPSDGEKPAN